MKRFFLKNKYKEIDDEFSDGDLIFGNYLLEELQKTISGRCFFVAPVADISSEKNLSVGAATGFFNKQKPGKGNHELLLSRGRSGEYQNRTG